MTPFCSQSSVAEPLAGSAPTQARWLFVEAPGRWGREALDCCSLPEQQRLALAALPPGWRVVLVRRPDRPLRAQRDRTVWLSGPGGDARRWRLPLDAPVLPHTLPGPGMAVVHPELFVCTNGARDRCCALAGRAVFDLVAASGAWECSHLGGHRFAPTAVRLPDLLVFGRLDGSTSAAAMAGDTPMDAVRGPAGWPAAVQAAAVAVWRRHGVVPLEAAEVRGDLVTVRLADRSAWRVPVEQIPVPERVVSCGDEPTAGQALRAGTPMPVGP